MVICAYGAELVQGTFPAAIDNFSYTSSDVEETEAELIKLLRGEAARMPSGGWHPAHEGIFYESERHCRQFSKSAFADFPYNHWTPRDRYFANSYGASGCPNRTFRHLWQGAVEGISISLLIKGLFLLEELCWASPSGWRRDDRGAPDSRTLWDRFDDLMANSIKSLMYAYTYSVTQCRADAALTKIEKYPWEQYTDDLPLNREKSNTHQSESMQCLIDGTSVP
jgi:hypothetical protein